MDPKQILRICKWRWPERGWGYERGYKLTPWYSFSYDAPDDRCGGINPEFDLNDCFKLLEGLDKERWFYRMESENGNTYFEILSKGELDDYNGIGKEYYSEGETPNKAILGALWEVVNSGSDDVQKGR